jgi:DNA replication and repair protein RecF
MHVDTLELEEFRIYRRATLEIPAPGLVILGDNAAGKSSIVEALMLLSTMRSLRTGSDRELINWESGIDLGFPPFARVRQSGQSTEGKFELEIGLQIESGNGESLKKSIRINGSPKRAIDAVGTLKAIAFTPEDVTLMTASPSDRRRHLDLIISQIDNRYVRALSRFNRVLEQRNSLLRQLTKDGAPPISAVNSQLSFWDDELVSHGATLVARRILTLRSLAVGVGSRYASFMREQQLSLAYVPNLGDDLVAGTDRHVELSTLEQKAANLFHAALENRRVDELRRGMTLVGPHRDDFAVRIDGKDVGSFGSRGQQRMAIVALKMAEADLIAAVTNEAPVVLLDDVLSELDAKNRTVLLESLRDCGNQLIVTTADPHIAESTILKDYAAVHVRGGQITPA